MGKLSGKRRKSLPSSAFAYPKQRKYPIHDLAHARNALSRAAQSGTSGTYATVARKVRARYGSKVASVGKKKGSLTAPSARRSRTTRSSSTRRRR